MGYGFIGNRLKNDEDSVFYTSCMYAYQPVFKECFGKEIAQFEGRLTKDTIGEFRSGVNKLSNPRYNLDHNQMNGYIDNVTHEQLVKDLNKLCDLMESNEVKYLFIS